MIKTGRRRDGGEVGEGYYFISGRGYSSPGLGTWGIERVWRKNALEDIPFNKDVFLAMITSGIWNSSYQILLLFIFGTDSLKLFVSFRTINSNLNGESHNQDDSLFIDCKSWSFSNMKLNVNLILIQY